MGSRYGAYGLALDLPTPEWLTPVPAAWPKWTLAWAKSIGKQQQHIDDDSALIRVRPAGYASINRHAHTTTLMLSTSPRDEAWVHPHLSTTAVITARWDSRLTFHAGSFVVDGRVWGVLGERTAGKSSFIAWQHLAGNLPFADDLLLTDGETAYAGPRCLDLRKGAAEHFGLGTAIGRIGTRDRWRHTLPPVTAQLPFAGFILLEWGSEPAVSKLGLGERIRCLAANRGLLVGEEPPEPWMRTLRAPMLRFCRPQDWARIDESMDALMSALRS